MTWRRRPLYLCIPKIYIFCLWQSQTTHTYTGLFKIIHPISNSCITGVYEFISSNCMPISSLRMSLVDHFEIIAYGDELVSVNMSSGQQKAFRVLRCSKRKSVTTVGNAIFVVVTGSTHRLLKPYVDGTNSFRIPGVCAKEKPKADLANPIKMWKDLEWIFNVVRVSQPTTQVDNLKSLEQLFGGFSDRV